MPTAKSFFVLVFTACLILVMSAFAAPDVCDGRAGYWCSTDNTHDSSYYYECRSSSFRKWMPPSMLSYFEGWRSCASGSACLEPGYHATKPCSQSNCGNNKCEPPETCKTCPGDCWQCGCDTSTCKLPSCRCPDLSIPGGLSLSDTPQFVILSFDDYINDDVWAELAKVLENSPRDTLSCPLRTTLFLHGYYQCYDLAEKVLALGGELSAHTATHSTSYSTSLAEWRNQISISKTCLNKLARRQTPMVGSRAPFLFWSSAMLKALGREGMLYDSSVICNYENHGGWPWPFLTSYGVPKLSYYAEAVSTSEKIWEIPLYAPLNQETGESEECMDPLDSWDDASILSLLKYSFDKHYTTNRAPYGVYWHPATLTRLNRANVLIEFLQYTQQFSNVFYATMSEVINWVQYPKTITQLRNSGGFNCTNLPINLGESGLCAPDNTPANECTSVGLRMCAQCPVNYVVGNPC